MTRQSYRPESDDEDGSIRMPPASNRDRRALQIAQAAEDLLEKRLLAGTASPTEVAAGLRLATAYELANVERIRRQTELLVAQKAKTEAETSVEKLILEATEALRGYRPKGEDNANLH